jgi:diaminopimelate decarboxylase
LVGNAGVPLTGVGYLKHWSHRNIAIVDAEMNHLMRPALYEVWHAIEPVVRHNHRLRRYEIVGLACESADFLGHDRTLAPAEGKFIAITSAFTHGMAMSFNYNARPPRSRGWLKGEKYI